jgi:hypothetical protein
MHQSMVFGLLIMKNLEMIDSHEISSTYQLFSKVGHNYYFKFDKFFHFSDVSGCSCISVALFLLKNFSSAVIE